MAGIGSSIGQTTTTFGNSDTNVTDFNLVCFTAGVEYSQALPANTKGFRLKAKLPCTITLSYSANGTNTIPITINPGVEYIEDYFFANKTIYFKTSIGSVILELRTYHD